MIYFSIFWWMEYGSFWKENILLSIDTAVTDNKVMYDWDKRRNKNKEDRLVSFVF